MTDRPIYAIGDIHGQIDMLHTALQRIDADGGPNANIVFLGDLVDRGPGSRSVIELLRLGQEQGRNWTVVRGNHDQLFLDFLSGGPMMSPMIKSRLSWLHPRIGGAETLASYGVAANEAHPQRDEAVAAVPRSHVDWLSTLPYWHETPELLFVHGGIRPEVALHDQKPEDLMWIRDPFFAHTGPHPWLVVHGHTALETPTHFGNRVDLDSGAGYGRPLTAAVFEGTQCWVLEDNGRRALRPENRL
ncbi:serine/threonine protein phosphatase [Litorivita pollutaquae]|uniref:Serine/threonine protein phosphatase n=1 Tax=Litorivita pollutaquae TaxID=2200892 RepID=A0A2V4N133_9RHOB|nr:metallophosphoesterase family protein [Litorivita pollutaquae]PYC47632.1 serine/threonine protein phosphatase [Litorivita pollutaquae]